jgi:hypothetical protein
VATALFISILLQEQALDESENKKARHFVPGFFFATDGRFEPTYKI